MTISVCIGSSCHIKGSKQIIDRLKQLTAEHGLTEKLEIKAVLCMDNCMEGACVRLDGRMFSLTPDTVDDFFKREILQNIIC
jgi:NADH:ubiquinone oxidoreductase subunit E